MTRELKLRGAPVLAYHGLGASIPPEMEDGDAAYWVEPGSFGRQLAAVRASGQRVVGLYDVWASQDDDRLTRSPVVLTFEDGRAAHYEVAFPLLLAAGVRAEFFLDTATVGRPGYLTWGRIAEMRRAGMSFQAHARDDVALARLPARRLADELRTAKRLIEDRVGRAVEFLAAPRSFVGRRLDEVARDIGYHAVCVSRGWPARPGGAVVNRIVVYRHTTESQFAAILARRPWGYLVGVARASLACLSPRALFKTRAPHLAFPLATDIGQRSR